MLKIRLKRVGRKHDPSFRIIVVDSRSSGSSNKYVDNIGFYDPRINRKDVDTERASHWISKGAQVSPTVHNIMVDAGVMGGRKKNVLPKKTAPVKEEAPAEVPAPAEEATPETPAEESAPEETTEEATPEVEAPVEEAQTEAASEGQSQEPAVPADETPASEEEATA